MNAEFLMETMLKFLDEGVLVVDCNMRVTFLNEPAGDITGIDKESALGQSIFEIFPELKKENSTLYRVIQTGKPLIDYVQTYENHKGKTVTKITSTVPLFDAGECIGALEIYREISHLKKLTERLSLLEKQLYYKKSGKHDFSGNGTTYSLHDIVGISDVVNVLKRQILKVSDSTSAVLVHGETGTGKELVVQSIHNASSVRKAHPFIAQNCAAIPHSLLESMLFGTSVGSFTGAQNKPGLFELAHKGTLFLDEINSLDLDLQAKLLRVLQDGIVRRVGDGRSIQVDVRVIAATNEEPLRLVEEGRLRPDLYYRLNVIALRVPPLRDRKEDIPALVKHFIERYNREMAMSVKAVDGACMATFMAYRWPGNIRELQFTIERMMNFATSDVLSEGNIPPSVTTQVLSMPKMLAASQRYEEISDYDDVMTEGFNEAMMKHERELITRAIEKSNGNYAQAARLLGLPRQTLHNKIKKHQIKMHVHITQDEQR